MARIHGVHAQIETFEFLFGAVLGEVILRHTDDLSRTLQSKSFSAAEGQQTADMVVCTQESVKEDEAIDSFWSKMSSTARLLIFKNLNYLVEERHQKGMMMA